DAFAKADAADAKIIRGDGVWLHKMIAAHFDWIEFQLFGELVDLSFECETRLRSSVPALGSTRRFVCEHAQAFKLVARNVVGHCLKRAGVKRARDAVASIRTTVEKRTEVHRGDRTVFFHAGLDPHQHRMPA